MTISADHREYVQSLERGLAIISAFGPGREKMTLSEIAKTTDLNKASARRFLLTLESLGHVRRDQNKFFLTPKVLDLGYSFLSSKPWWSTSLPFLQDLAEQIGLPCGIGVLNGLDIVYVAYTPTKRVASINITPGYHIPAYVSALGRVCLSHHNDVELDEYFSSAKFVAMTKKTVTDPSTLREIIKQTRADGFSIVNEEVELGLIALAVPIFDRSGAAVAALHVSAINAQVKRKDLVEKMLPVLRATSAKITSSLV